MQADILKETYPYKTELHAHTLPISLCSRLQAEDMVKLYKEKGADSIVLTNHFTPFYISERSKEEAVRAYIEGFRELKKYAEENGISAIFGIELRFTENINDYLIYGITENDLDEIYELVDKGIAYFYKTFKREGVMIFQAHPFRPNMSPPDVDSLDGVEAFNMNPRKDSRVPTSILFAKEHNLLICGGSDTHLPEDVGCCFIRTKKKLETPADVANVLKEQDFVLDICGSIVLP